MAWELIPSAQARKIKRLEKESSKISKSQTNLSISYSNLSTARDQIKATIEQLTVKDFSKHKEVIDSMSLEEEYKKSAIVELDNSRTRAIDTLNPLLEKAERLRCNMIVTQEKSLQYLAVIKAQKEVAKAGEIQVEVLSRLQEHGQELSERIDELVTECERINNITENAIEPFKQNKSTKGGLLGFNPIVEGK